MKDGTMSNIITVARMKELVLAGSDIMLQSFDDKTGQYRLDTHESLQLACRLLGLSSEFVFPMYLMMDDYLNDALDWAGDFDGRESKVAIPPNFVFPIKEN